MTRGQSALALLRTAARRDERNVRATRTGSGSKEIWVHVEGSDVGLLLGGGGSVDPLEGEVAGLLVGLAQILPVQHLRHLLATVAQLQV
jgi:hypothetical protein